MIMMLSATSAEGTLYVPAACNEFVRKCGSVERAADELEQHTRNTFTKGIPTEDSAGIYAHIKDMLGRSNHYLPVPFTPDELRDRLQALKSGKTGGPSGISADLLKIVSTSACGMELLEQMMNQMLLHGTLPKHLKDSWVALIPKVTDVFSCRQLRPTCLLEPLQKLYAALLVKRLQSVWPEMRFQFGGAANKQALDGLFAAVSFLSREAVEGDPSVWISLDLQAAFDSVSYMHLAKHVAAHTPDGFAREGARLLELILYPTMQFGWRHHRWTVTADTGVQQGGSHSSYVFSHIINGILQDFASDIAQDDDLQRLGVFGWAYIDDLLLRFRTWTQAAALFPKLLAHLQHAGFQINLEKTTVMSTAAMLTSGRDLLHAHFPDSALLDCKFGEHCKYLRKTLAVKDDLTPDLLVHAQQACHAQIVAMPPCARSSTGSAQKPRVVST